MMHERIMKVNRCDDFVFERKQGLRADPSATLVLQVVPGRVVKKTTFPIVNKQQDTNCPRRVNGLQVCAAFLTLFLRFPPGRIISRVMDNNKQEKGMI